MHSDAVYRRTYLAAAPSLGHLDHVIRHNAVGRPLAGEVSAVTLSTLHQKTGRQLDELGT